MSRLPYRRFPIAWEVFGLFVLPAITMAAALSPEVTAISEASSVISSDTTRTGDIEAMASEIADSMVQYKTDTLSDLAGMYRQEQTRWLIFAPPSSDFVVRQDYGMVVFAPKAFPDDFNKKLVGEMKYDCPVYALTISEDPVSHETVFSNADGKETTRLKPEDGYNPYWLLEWQHPELYTGIYSAQDIKNLQAAYDPGRIQITLTLLPADYLDQYALAAAEEKVKQAADEAATTLENQKSKLGGGMLKYQSSGMTNLEIAGFAVATNGMKLTLAYPNDFTNRVDIFTCPDLIGNWWDLAVNATNISSSTNFIQWVDVNAFSQSPRFYAAGNTDRDTDGDGIPDAREQFMYHTNINTNDSDGDGLTDSNEVFVTHTDPNDPDTNAPTAWISFPTNFSVKVWYP